MALRATKSYEEPAGGGGRFRGFFAGSSTELIAGIS
jgi:hypothetical protein